MMSRNRGFTTLGSVVTVILLALLLAGAAWALPPRSAQNAGGETLAKPSEVSHAHFDGNTIDCIMTNDGLIVDDRVTGSSGMEWPKGTGKTIDFASGLWLAGIGRDDGLIYTACAEYASELVAGPLGSTSGDEAYRIYKINKDGTGDWDDWPVDQGAPVDENGDPAILGDQTLWWVCNDGNSAQHSNVFSTAPMDVEVHIKVFGFNRADPMGNIMFIEWKFINKGDQAFDSCFVAQWDDPDLGDASDDLVGCDTTLSLGYCYNGGPVDGIYGTTPPALGFDFFQGPEVEGEYLGMTAFAWYYNGAPDPFDDPEIPAEAYWYMNGYAGDGTPYTDQDGNETIFPFAGDPVAGTGHLDGEVVQPGDRRFLMSSGPFILAPGDTQIVVGAKIIAPGINATNAVAALRFFDGFAQNAYDNGFVLPSAPEPQVNVVALDEQIVLSWQEGYETVEAYDFSGYTFQGYNVYQGESVSGPWTRLATFDIVDDYGIIFDNTFDPETGLVLEKPVQWGANTGMQRYYVIDEDVINQAPLSNFRRYYLAVTSYALAEDPAIAPRTVESPKTALAINDSLDYLVPEERFEDDVIGVVGDTVEVEHTAGVSEGVVAPIVVDPTALTGDDYQVSFFATEVVDDHGDTVEGMAWKLNNTSTGRVLLDDQMNQTGDQDYQIVDGMLVKVMGPPVPGMKDWDIPSGTRRFTWAGGSSGWGLEGFSGAMGWWQPATWWGSGYSYPAGLLKNVLLVLATVDTLGNFDPNDPNVSYGYRYLRAASSPPARPEFAPFIVNPGDGYAYQDFTKGVPIAAYDYEDPDNPRRLAVGHFENNVEAGMVDGKYWPPDYNVGDNTAAREFLYIFDVDYSETPDPSLEIENTNDMPIMWTVVAERRGNVPFSPDQTGEDQFLILANHINTANDIFSFTAPDEPLEDAGVEQANLDKIKAVPNPYFGFNPQERIATDRFVTFTHMPADGATIRIFTLDGTLVKIIDDDERELQGTLGTSMAYWYLRNQGGDMSNPQSGVPVASGMYLAHIEVEGVGDKILKMAVFMPEERLDFF